MKQKSALPVHDQESWTIIQVELDGKQRTVIQDENEGLRRMTLSHQT